MLKKTCQAPESASSKGVSENGLFSLTMNCGKQSWHVSMCQKAHAQEMTQFPHWCMGRKRCHFVEHRHMCMLTSTYHHRWVPALFLASPEPSLGELGTPLCHFSCFGFACQAAGASSTPRPSGSVITTPLATLNHSKRLRLDAEVVPEAPWCLSTSGAAECMRGQKS